MNALRNHHLVCGARSEISDHRPDNQDAGYAGPALALVADGVGGSPGGDLASATIIHALVDSLGAACTEQAGQLRAVLAAANDKLNTLVERNTTLRGLATTLCGLVVGAGRGFIVHIGDSRAYLLRDGCLTPQTEDQTWTQLLVTEGMLQPDAAEQHPMRNLLLHSLSGASSDADAALITEVRLRIGDRWLLVTDGVTDYLPVETMAALAASTIAPQELADALVKVCLPVSQDNISVVVADVRAGPAGPSTAPSAGKYIGTAETLPGHTKSG